VRENAERFALAEALVGFLHELLIRSEVPHAIEAVYVMDLVEDRERQHLADARDPAQRMEGLRVVLLGLAHQVALEVGQQRVVAIEYFDPVKQGY